MRIAIPKSNSIRIPPTRGKVGKDGINGMAGRNGFDGKNGVDGLKGINGISGKNGLNGLAGINGRDGFDGKDGQQGAVPAHRWKGESLQFQNPDGTWGKLIDLRGNQGASGHNFVGGSSIDTIVDELIELGYIDAMYAKEIDFESNGDITYIGEANPGSLTSEAKWRINKITVVNAEGDTTIAWADGDANFNNIWDNHLSLTYS